MEKQRIHTTLLNHAHFLLDKDALYYHGGIRFREFQRYSEIAGQLLNQYLYEKK